MANEITLLLVDDDDLLRTGLAGMLERQGYRVIQAAGGNEALAIVQRISVDLVLTDTRMPNGDGIDLVKKLKVFNPSLPVIMFVTSTGQLKVDEAYAIGAIATLAKPFPKEKLLLAVNKSITKKLHPVGKNTEPTPGVVEKMISGALDESLLGRGGFVWISETQIPVGHTLRFNLNLSFTVANIKIEGRGVVRWMNAGQEGKKGVGVEILNLSPESQILFQAWLHVRQPAAFIPQVA